MFTVLGSSGIIGRHMVKYLHSLNIEVFTPCKNDGSIYNRPLGQLIYSIGITADFRTRPYDTVRAHAGVLAEILERCDFESLLYLSSTRIYSGAETTDEEASFSVTPGNPSDLYNISKIMGESLCLNCGRAGIRIARLSNVVGGDDKDSDNFLPTLVREARQGKIILRTDPESAKDYIHIDDVTTLLHRIAIEGKSAIYNVASGRQVTHGQWTELLQNLTGCTVETMPGSPLIRFPPIDISRITEEFCYRPKPVLEALYPDQPQPVRRNSWESI